KQAVSRMLFRFSFDGLNRAGQLHPAPGGIVVTASVDQEATAVVPSLPLGVNDLGAVHVADSCGVPPRAALSDRRRHGDPGFSDKAGFASFSRVHADRIVHRVAWQRLLDVSLAFGAVTPPCAVGRLARVDDKTEGVIPHAEFLGRVLPWRFDEPADR